MAGLKRFDYTNKDYNDIIQDTIVRIKQTYGEKYWNDFEEDNVGRMLIETFAYITDLLLFYLDRQANETYLPTATERQNVINMCKLIGYIPKPAKPAVVSILVSVDKIHETNITLPAGTVLQTQSGLNFETKEDAVIVAGNTSTEVGAVEGETFTETLGISTGEAWQNFHISRSGIIEIVKINIDNHEWQYVDSFADQEAGAEVFNAEIDAWRRAEIFFGDGKTGKIPNVDEIITVTYRVGGGIIGNVAPNTITLVRDIATDEHGEQVHVNVTNPEWATGGTEPESLDSVKLWAPRYYETQDRCVTKQDYETFANKYEGIAKSNVVIDEDLRDKGEANVIHIYVLTYGQQSNTVALANSELKANLLAYLNRYKMLTDWLEIEDGIFTDINFEGTITIVSGFNSDTVLASVKNALNLLMSIDIRNMGEPLRISDVYAALDNIEGVSFVELSKPAQSIIPSDNELLTLGNVNFKITS